MKAAVLHQYDTSLTNQEYVQLEEVPEPKLLNDTDVIVRIGGAGVCRTDLHVIEGIWRQKVDVKLPYILGHENAGWVEEVGKGVQGFKRGDPVLCHPLISNCHALAARWGRDMHVGGSEFPGALGTVTDPEIDESVTTLKFVTGVVTERNSLGNNQVQVAYVLVRAHFCVPHGE